MPVGDPGGQFNGDWPPYPNNELYPKGFGLKVERGRVPSTIIRITISDEAGALFLFTVKRDGRCFIERRADTYRPLSSDVGEGTTQGTTQGGSARLRGGHTFPRARIARGGVPPGPRPGPRMSSLNHDAEDSKAGQ